MVDGFILPLSSRSRDVGYVSPPAPVMQPAVGIGPGAYDPIYLFEDSISLELVGQTVGINLPPGYVLPVLWEKISGPGPIGLSDNTSRTPTATFSQPGVYVMGISTSYGDAYASAQVSIEVRAVVYQINNSTGIFGHPEQTGFNLGDPTVGYGQHVLVWARTGANTRLLLVDIPPATLLNNVHCDITSAFHTDEFKAIPGNGREIFVTLWDEDTNVERPVSLGTTGYNPVSGGVDSWAENSIGALPGEYTIDFPPAFEGSIMTIVQPETLQSMLIPNFRERGGEFAVVAPFRDNPLITISSLGSSSVYVTSDGVDFDFSTQGDTFSGTPFVPGESVTLVFDLSGRALLGFTCSVEHTGPFFSNNDLGRPIISFGFVVALVPIVFTITAA